MTKTLRMTGELEPRDGWSAGASCTIAKSVELLSTRSAFLLMREAFYGATSTMTAIMGRMATYSGQEVSWEQALNSDEKLMPEGVELGKKPVAPVAIPGRKS